MTTIRKLPLLLVAGCVLAVSAKAQEIETPSQPKSLPFLIEPEIRGLLKQGEFQQAKARCTQMIQAATLVSESGELAGPFLCLGEALYGQRNYKAAAVAFKNSVDQLSVSTGVFDPRLVRPLDGLGKTLIRLGKYEEALDVLGQAKDLTHRNFGIYNLVQTNIVNRISRSYLDLGEKSKANREQKFLLRANEETYGEAPQLLPALRRMGKWHERVGRADLARSTYRRALAIMDRAYGPDDLRRAGPLRDYARSYLNTPRGADRVMSGAGARALLEVVDLYKRQEFTDAVDVAKAWGELGDWYVIGGRRRLGRAAYAEAGKVLETAGGETAGTEFFSRPVEIEYEDVPISMRPSRIGSFPEGIAIIEFEFTVTSSGRVSNVVVVRDDLDYPRFALEVAQRVKASRYRPRLLDGLPVDTDGVKKVLRYDFSRHSKGAKSEDTKVVDKTGQESKEESSEQSDGGAQVDVVGELEGEPIESTDTNSDTEVEVPVEEKR